MQMAKECDVGSSPAVSEVSTRLWDGLKTCRHVLKDYRERLERHSVSDAEVQSAKPER